MSLDGYIARRDGAVDFLLMDPDYDFAAFLSGFDTWLMGRKTMDAARKLSPGGRFDPAGLRCYICDGVEYTNRPPGDLIAELRKSSGKNIWLGGGGELARECLQADLVDRIDLGVVPVLLGDGIPLFPAGFPERKFSLLESRSYSKTGMLTVSYERVRG